MGKKDDPIFGPDDLPEGVTFNSAVTLEELSKRKDSDIDEVRRENLKDIRTYRGSNTRTQHRVKRIQYNKSVTKPGKVNVIMSPMIKVAQEIREKFDNCLQKIKEGDVTLGDWLRQMMVDFVNDNDALIGKPRDLTIVKMCSLISMMMYPGTYEDHANSVNEILKTAKIKLKFESEEIKSAIKYLAKGVPYNHLKKYIQSRFLDGLGKGAMSYYWIPPEFMGANPKDLYSLSTNRFERNFSEHDLKRQFPDYFKNNPDLELTADPEEVSKSEDTTSPVPEETVEDFSRKSTNEFRDAVEKALAAGMKALRDGNAVTRGVSARIGDKEISITIEKLVVQFY